MRFFIKPFNWFFFLFALYFYLKNPKKKKAALWSIILLAFVLSNPFLSSEAMKAWEYAPTPIAELPVYEVGVVLGGCTFVMDGLEDRVHLNKNGDRLIHAVQLFKEGKIKNIMVLGGGKSLSGKLHDEAANMKRVLLLNGVPEENIFTEHKSLNTRENALFGAEELKKHFPNEKVLLITSAFHIRRSIGCFEQVGVMHDPYAVAFLANYGEYNFSHFLFPSAGALHNWEILIDELTGYVVYKLKGYA